MLLTLELAGNTARMNITSHMVDILLKRHLILNLTKMKSKRFKNGDPTNYNFTQPLGIKEILDELGSEKYVSIFLRN